MTLKEVILLTHEYYNRGAPLSDQVLLMYASDLSDLEPKKCIAAYEQYRRSPANKTFPLPAQIRALVNPEEFVTVEAKAREIAARICAAVPKFGWNNGSEARAFIGPEGWDVVQRQGGWQHLCEFFGWKINPSSFQAQVRDQVEASLHYGRQTIEESISAIPENRARRGTLENAKGILALIPVKDSEPDGAA